MKKSAIIIGLIILFSGVSQGFFVKSVGAETDYQIQSDLEKQLAELQVQIDEYERQLATTQKQKQSLAAKIKTLNIQRSKLKLQIEQTQKRIEEAEKQINTTKDLIEEKKKHEQALENELSELLREVSRQNTNTVMVLAAHDSISDIFQDIFAMDTLTRDLCMLVPEVRTAKAALVKAQSDFEEQKDSAVQLLNIKSVQQQDLVSTLNKQNTILQETKGKESNYQAVLADTKKRAQEIRSRLYELFQSGKSITFGEAVSMANWVSNQTGVRTAFLLAILTQESNLGKNVGTCNRAGDPAEKGWRVIMKPTRDHEPYLKITEELGLDPNITPLSCPMHDKKGNQIGWGGAMGPAQFIPSTWMGYRSKVSAITGKSANPWDIRDAFIASAIKLKADGADGTEKGEWNAAMRYFSGSTNPKYRFYADSVASIAKQYEQDIDDISQ